MNLDGVRSLARFAVVGLAATAVHVAVFSLLVEKFGIAPVAASVPAFLTAMLASYRLNQGWTFRAEGKHREYLPKYALVAAFGLGLNVVITYISVNMLGFGYGIALAAVVTVVPVATFLLNRNWSFKATTDARSVDTQP